MHHLWLAPLELATENLNCALVFVHLIERLTIYMSNGSVFWFLSDLLTIHNNRNLCFLQNLLTLVHFLLNGWIELDTYLLLGIEHVHIDFVLKVILDDIVDNIEACLHRYFLYGIACEFLYLVIGQVIDKVLLCSC